MERARLGPAGKKEEKKDRKKREMEGKERGNKLDKKKIKIGKIIRVIIFQVRTLIKFFNDCFWLVNQV